ncbi:uncharacterized protein PAC_18332 [Phialocephala subalpina]|uniref:N-acetyltransferase domain-containing protein n=1 Tax=Phialocephala subalpina TaxID=576137 RepID=A0A1L7XTS0_9HELO|nr:uncharacterized protein PAC_18332 [Phialocephala subalpina]
MSTRSNITIRPARLSDLIHLTRLDLAANSNHPLIALSFPYPFLATKLFLERLQYCFARPERYHFLIATLTSSTPLSELDSVVGFGAEKNDSGCGEGEVVGFLMWNEGEAKDEGWDWETRLPKGTDAKLWKHYTKVMGDDPLRIPDSVISRLPSTTERDRFVNHGTEMEVLAVAPVYQRRGIGTLLLHTFIHEVERLGKQETINLRASKNARPLYEKFGWRVANEYRMNLRDWGRHSMYVDYGMVRHGSKSLGEEARL